MWIRSEDFVRESNDSLRKFPAEERELWLLELGGRSCSAIFFGHLSYHRNYKLSIPFAEFLKGVKAGSEEFVLVKLCGLSLGSKQSSPSCARRSFNLTRAVTDSGTRTDVSYGPQSF